MKNNLSVSCYSIFISLIYCIVTTACTDITTNQSNAEKDLLREVLSFYREDSVASFYVDRYKLGSSQKWDDFIISNVDTFLLDDLSATAYLFKLPQFCGGCYNYYKVLGIVSNDGKFDYFSLMDAYYYQQETAWERDNKNLLEKGINSVLSKYIIFEDFSFESPQDIKELHRFIEFICKDLLGCSRLDSIEDFKRLIGEIEADSDFICLDQMRKFEDRVNKILSSKKHILYMYHGALYEFAFSKEGSEALRVNVILYPASCFNNYMI